MKGKKPEGKLTSMDEFRAEQIKKHTVNIGTSCMLLVEERETLWASVDKLKDKLDAKPESD